MGLSINALQPGDRVFAQRRRPDGTVEQVEIRILSVNETDGSVQAAEAGKPAMPVRATNGRFHQWRRHPGPRPQWKPTPAEDGEA